MAPRPGPPGGTTGLHAGLVLLLLAEASSRCQAARFRRRGEVLGGGLGAAASDAPIPVDFFVFKSEEGKVPMGNMGIAGAGDTSGFYVLCGKSEKCPMGNEYRKYSAKVAKESLQKGYTTPRMDFCPCVAELLVADLNDDFGELRSAGPRSKQAAAGRRAAAVFEMGRYEELPTPSPRELPAGVGSLYDVEDGHKALHWLMSRNGSESYKRRPGRLVVWIANHIEGHTEGSMLAGTTYLDMPLYRDAPGPAVLLHGQVGRPGRRLSHEVGHVVGFHHVAGPSIEYSYVHDQECGTSISWHTVEKPSCELNIMGGWYDGPYCCPAPASKPAENASSSGSATASGSCLKSDGGGGAYCCGEGCTHRCPKSRPEMTFATEEHRRPLAEIFECWEKLRGLKAPPPLPRGGKASSLLQERSKTGAGGGEPLRWVCSDLDDTSGAFDQLRHQAGSPCRPEPLLF